MIYDCPRCKDTEIIYNPETNTAALCTCKKAKQYKKMYEKSGISKVFAQKSFENFSVEKKPQIIIAAKQVAMAYVKGFDEKRSIGLLGQVGAGKTHLCIAIANCLLQKNIGVLYMQYREVITHLKQNMIDEEFYQGELNKYKSAPVLLIDDLYKGSIRDADHNIMFEIINHRYIKGLPIIISSEYGAKDLVGFDEAIGSRIVEMCKGFLVEFPRKIELNHRLVV